MTRVRSLLSKLTLALPWRWPALRVYSAPTRAVILAAFMAGIVTLVWCWRVDLSDSTWWHNRSYIPNVWAGFTGFLIGAPVGLVVLAQFTTERQENATLARVNRLSTVAYDNLRHRIHEFCSAERIAALQEHAQTVDRAHKLACAVVSNYIRVMPHGQSVSDTTALTSAHARITESYPPFQAAVSTVTGALKDPESLAVQWAGIVGAWNTLDQYVRLQRLERDLEWFDAGVDAELRKWMSRKSSPLEIFARLHGFRIDAKSATSMVKVVTGIGVYAQMSDSDLSGALARNDALSRLQVPDYRAHAIEATEFLLRLLHCLREIDRAQWPHNQTSPRPATTS